MIPHETRLLLERRAARLRTNPRIPEEAVLWVAEFPVGEATYAIALDRLRAALPLRLVTQVPLAAPQIVGVLRFRDRIISALSLATVLGGRGWNTDPAVLLVVDAGEGRLAALDCEQIPKPVALPVRCVEEARPLCEGPVVEVTTPDFRRVCLIDDLARLLAPVLAG
ncbi:MAG: chemotaxis protein CheW, partial [Pseudomonadota bacterium]